MYEYTRVEDGEQVPVLPQVKTIIPVKTITLNLTVAQEMVGQWEFPKTLDHEQLSFECTR